jgi:putative redox protein
MPGPEPNPSDTDSPEGVVVVTSTGEGPFQQRVRAGRHLFLADEPPGVGDDSGPSPYDLLLASLGTCTSMTINMYAVKKGWPLEGLSVRLTHDRHHGEDCDHADEGGGAGGHPPQIDHIRRTISLFGPLDDEQRSRLLEIAERCPVHRTLSGPIHINTDLA